MTRLLMLVPLLCQTHAADPSFARSGLLFDWDAHRASGANVTDGSPNGRDAAIIGPARIEASPARIELDLKAALVAKEPIRPARLSLEAVVRVDRVYGPGLQLIVTGYRAREDLEPGATGNPRQWTLEIRGTPPQSPHDYRGHLSFGVYGDDDRWHFAFSDAPTTRGWHHVVGTFDGRQVRLYVHGKVQGCFPWRSTGVFGGRIHVPPDEVIKRSSVGLPSDIGRGGFDGAVALVRAYDRGLSAAEAHANWAYAQTLGIDYTPAPATRRPRAKAPFRVLFSNDTTNISSCDSPYHRRGEPFTTERVQATVDEVDGVDVHLLQPGLGWIPWWPSKVYPLEEHCRQFTARTGLKPDPFARYVLAGNDLIQVFIDRCRQRGQTPFVSYRLNDSHCLEYAGTKHGRSVAVCRFYADHPEYRLRPGSEAWSERVQNWAIKAVRDYKFALIKEACEQYDIDGLELDFMRHSEYFRPEETTFKQRAAIMTGFVERVRRMLDESAPPGKRRWLCARVPCELEQHDRLGIDLPVLADAGLDMANLSASYFTKQQNDVAWMRRLVPNLAIYVEMTHCTTTGPSRGNYDSSLFRRTTDEQFYTAAHLAYERGADGMSLFNFVYFRRHGTPGRGPFNEPPFHVLRRLGQPEWLAKQQPWYVVTTTWGGRSRGRHGLPVRVSKGDAATVLLDMAANAVGREGVFRLMTTEETCVSDWAVAINGKRLAAASFVRKPIPHPYEGGMGIAEQYRCFACPPDAVRSGFNKVTLKLVRGDEAVVSYIDLVLR